MKYLALGLPAGKWQSRVSGSLIPSKVMVSALRLCCSQGWAETGGIIGLCGVLPDYYFLHFLIRRFG